MPKGIYQRQNKREEILRAAVEVYAHYGFEGATIERMAQEAGVSKSLVLEYFTNKQELVKAIVNWAVTQTQTEIQAIDAIPGITLRQREWEIHELMKQDRERWCLVLGTVLVPSFEFQQRDELNKLLYGSLQTIRAHSEELKDPSDASMRTYAHTAFCVHLGFLIDGREDDFHEAMLMHVKNYLNKTEKEEDKLGV